MADKKKNTGFKLALWILAILILLIIFLVKSDDIISNLKETQFFDRVFGTTPEFIKKHETKEKSDKISVLPEIQTEPVKKDRQAQTPEQSVPPEENQLGEQTEQQPVQQEETPPVSQPQVNDGEALPVPPPAEKPVETTPTGIREKSPSVKTKTTETPPPVVVKETKINLCFVNIDADGTVSRKEVTRSLPHTDMPLTDAIKALLGGPNVEETGKDCMTLIPSGTKLLSASIKNNIAYLNFNDEFEFNIPVKNF